ncbi:hypothetical protein [Nannocystis bainbridge]|uniref:Outer membrane protein beta-barrel domain-containing protein n=1 Tax=Nannocystis bainbridge TaxID=2995303 RepID=A0ABT5DWB7_9BACT|nr:hypothetical protein [Nannocystis bainbridge]MDC0717855.1 hypothetical protein [Nannocystis bainbridge]
MRSPQQPRSRDRARRGRIAALAGLLGLLPARAVAMPTIGWEAPAGCPSAERVARRIGEVVGARPVSPAVTAVRARVEKQGAGWLLVVVFSGRDGATERRLTLHDCEATANATALLVGIALVGPPAGPEGMPQAVPVPVREGEGEGEAGDEGRGRAAGDGGAGSEGRGRAAQGDERASYGREDAAGMGVGESGGRERAAGFEARGRERAAGAATGGREAGADGATESDGHGRAGQGSERGADGGPRSAAVRVRAFVHVGPALAVGVLPRATAGLTAAVGVAWPRLRVALGYARWFRSPARWAEERQIGADLSLHVASLRAGPVRRVGPVELQAGLGLEFGALRAAGFGSEVDLERRTWWGGALVGGALAWAPRALRGRGALQVHAELVVPLHRPNLLYNREPIFRLGAVGMRAGLQLEARLF